MDLKISSGSISMSTPQANSKVKCSAALPPQLVLLQLPITKDNPEQILDLQRGTLRLI